MCMNPGLRCRTRNTRRMQREKNYLIGQKSNAKCSIHWYLIDIVCSKQRECLTLNGFACIDCQTHKRLQPHADRTNGTTPKWNIKKTASTDASRWLAVNMCNNDKKIILPVVFAGLHIQFPGPKFLLLCIRMMVDMCVYKFGVVIVHQLCGRILCMQSKNTQQQQQHEEGENERKRENPIEDVSACSIFITITTQYWTDTTTVLSRFGCVLAIDCTFSLRERDIRLHY